MDGDDCGGIGGWTRIAHVDMTESNAVCPEGLMQNTRGDLELCERVSNTGGCDSSHFTTHGIEYQQVCGRIRGYQLGTPEAFARSFLNPSWIIEDAYLNGISFTHGAPSERVHIWSFPAGLTIIRDDNLDVLADLDPQSMLHPLWVTTTTAIVWLLVFQVVYFTPMDNCGMVYVQARD